MRFRVTEWSGQSLEVDALSFDAAISVARSKGLVKNIQKVEEVRRDTSKRVGD
jgi:hypothetical protein